MKEICIDGMQNKLIFKRYYVKTSVTTLIILDILLEIIAVYFSNSVKNSRTLYSSPCIGIIYSLIYIHVCLKCTNFYNYCKLWVICLYIYIKKESKIFIWISEKFCNPARIFLEKKKIQITYIPLYLISMPWD